jgi:hypothetical protein
VLIGPSGINAFVYMTVARLIYFAHPDQKVWGVKATWLTKSFVWLDIVSFIVQAAGGSMLSNNESPETIRAGQQVYMVGIGVQGAFVIVFAAMTVAFYLAIRNRTTTDSSGNIKRVKILTWIAFVVLVLIMVSPDPSTRKLASLDVQLSGSLTRGKS